jgi:predicted hydrocarbon binding protein
MKGIVFNLLEQVMVRQFGEDTWDSLLEAAELEGSYTSLGSYPDQDMQKLVVAASKVMATTPSEVLRWFGRKAIPVLEERYPHFFSAHASTRPFILSVNSIIHPEVRKIYPGADVPVFDFRDAPDGALLMGYESARKLCALAQGFVEGAAAHYGEVFHFEHLKCMHKGDSKCLFRLSLSHTALH